MYQLPPVRFSLSWSTYLYSLMSVCVYVCVSVCMSVCLSVCHIHVFINKHSYTCTHVHHAHTHEHTHALTQTYVHVYALALHIHIHLCTHTCTCTRLHMHVHIHTVYMCIYTRHTCTITAKKQKTKNMALWFYALRMWRAYGIKARCPAQHARRFHGFVRYSSRRFMSLLDRMLKTSATVAAKHGRLTKASHLCCTCMA